MIINRSQFLFFSVKHSLLPGMHFFTGLTKIWNPESGIRIPKKKNENENLSTLKFQRKLKSLGKQFL